MLPPNPLHRSVFRFLFTMYVLLLLFLFLEGTGAEGNCVYVLHHVILVSRLQPRRTAAVNIWSKLSSPLVQWTFYDFTWIQAHPRLFGNTFSWDVTLCDVLHLHSLFILRHRPKTLGKNALTCIRRLSKRKSGLRFFAQESC